MKLGKLSLAVAVAGIFLLPQLTNADTRTAWVTGVVVTESGKVVRDAEVTVRTPEGEIVTETETGDSGYSLSTFSVSYLTVEDDPYIVVIKRAGETYRYTMPIRDYGAQGNHAYLFVLADDEAKAHALKDGQLYRWKGVRTTSAGNVVVYFSASLGESDSPYIDIHSFNIGTGRHRKLTDLNENINRIYHDSLAISPDGKHVATVFDNPMTEETTRIEIWNISAVERVFKKALDDGKYFSEYNGGSTFAGAYNYDLEWLNDNCLQTAIYEDSAADPDASQKQFVENRTYCF